MLMVLTPASPNTQHTYHPRRNSESGERSSRVSPWPFKFCSPEGRLRMGGGELRCLCDYSNCILHCHLLTYSVKFWQNGFWIDVPQSCFYHLIIESVVVTDCTSGLMRQKGIISTSPWLVKESKDYWVWGTLGFFCVAFFFLLHTEICTRIIKYMQNTLALQLECILMFLTWPWVANQKDKWISLWRGKKIPDDLCFLSKFFWRHRILYNGALAFHVTWHLSYY